MKPAASTAAAPAQTADRPHCEGPSFASGTRYMATLLVLSLVVFGGRHADHPLVAMLSTQATLFVLIVVGGWQWGLFVGVGVGVFWFGWWFGCEKILIDCSSS